MTKYVASVLFALSVVTGVEAAPTDTVTQADLKALIERISKLEAENQAQAKRIAELEAAQSRPTAAAPAAEAAATTPEEGTTTNETGRIWTTAQGFKYYLADKGAGIFEPLSESGLKITPYGYLVFEAVYNTKGAESDSITDWVKSRRDPGYRNHTSTFSMQDSILGAQFETPEIRDGWKFIGRAEFDFAGAHANDYPFHWRHLYFDARHESGWSFLFGQTWHLWKMVTPSEIDGAWMENTGHPYRRSPQFRVTKVWDMEDSSVELRLGVVKNGPGMGGDRDGDGTQDNSASAWPLFEAALLYNRDATWQEEGDLGGDRWTVGVGGMYGQERSRHIGGGFGEQDDLDSMMGMVAAKVPFGNFTLTGQFFAGENLGGVQAGVGQRAGQDMTGHWHEVRTVGGFLDLAYQLNATWSFAIGYGFDNPQNTDAQRLNAGGRLFNDRAYIDAFYRINENFKLGLEYGRLSTKWADEGTASDDRVQFSAFYYF